jgi:hypothetical protein
MAAEKKTWLRPELVVLVRGRPEEAVLAGCKIGGSSGPANHNKACRGKGTPCLIMNGS